MGWLHNKSFSNTRPTFSPNLSFILLGYEFCGWQERNSFVYVWHIKINANNTFLNLSSMCRSHALFCKSARWCIVSCPYPCYLDDNQLNCSQIRTGWMKVVWSIVVLLPKCGMLKAESTWIRQKILQPYQTCGEGGRGLDWGFQLIRILRWWGTYLGGTVGLVRKGHPHWKMGYILGYFPI